MKEEAGGQVGGLEMRRQGRERLAAESAGWRCAGCGGRSNEEILRECKERCEGEERGGKKREEEKVPEELRLGYRDELGGRKEGEGSEKVLPAAGVVDPISPTSSTTPGLMPDSEQSGRPTTTGPIPTTINFANAANTAPVPSLPTIPTASSSILFSPPPPPPRPPTAPVPARTIHVRPPRPPRHVSTAAAVPGWVDKAIVGVVLGLVVMVVRKMVLYL